jgi:hypothetical protein
MKITISNEHTEFCTFVETDGQDVLITEAYIGPKLVTDEGEELSICMRDNGFEVTYLDADDVEHCYSFNDGFVRRLSLKGRNASNVVPFKPK